MRKKSVLLGVAAATMLMTAGCKSKYEKIEAPGAIVESAAEEQKAGISENKAELTTESAPAMEAREQSKYEHWNADIKNTKRKGADSGGIWKNISCYQTDCV